MSKPTASVGFTQRPCAIDLRAQRIINRKKSTRIHLDSRFFQAKIVCVGRAALCNQ